MEKWNNGISFEILKTFGVENQTYKSLFRNQFLALMEMHMQVTFQYSNNPSFQNFIK